MKIINIGIKCYFIWRFILLIIDFEGHDYIYIREYNFFSGASFLEPDIVLFVYWFCKVLKFYRLKL